MVDYKYVWTLLAALWVSAPAVAMETPQAFQQSFSTALEAAQIPGGVAVLVTPQGTWLAAHGQIQRQRGVPADPQKSLFLLGDISDIFGKTALLKLIQEQKLDPATEVNLLLKDTRIYNSFDPPLTLQDLLLQRDGFEEMALALWAEEDKRLPDLRKVVETRFKPLALPPGTALTPGGYGSVLNAYLVQILSRTSYENYVQREILNPLGMTQTRLRREDPRQLPDQLVIHYDGQTAIPPMMAVVPAAHGIRSTAADMGRWMAGVLQAQGPFAQAHVRHSLISDQWSPVKGLPGVSSGLFAERWGSTPIYQRTSLHLGSFAQVLLVPDRKLGLFIAYNQARPEPATTLIAKVLGTPSAPVAIAPTLDYKQLAGTYGPVNYSHYSFRKALRMVEGQVQVKPLETGLALSSSGANPYLGVSGTSEWVEVAPAVFQQREGLGRIAFSQEQGRWKLHAGQGQHSSFERLHWSEMPLFNLLLALGLGGILFTMFVRSLRFFIQVDPTGSRVGWEPPLFAGLASGLAVGFWGGFMPVLQMSGRLGGEPSYAFAGQLDFALVGLLVLPLAVVVLTVFLLLFLVAEGKRLVWTRKQALHYLLTLFALVGFVTWTARWNLIGFQF
jgi:CubicO group peptidase (beta-lactamase class C family)